MANWYEMTRMCPYMLRGNCNKGLKCSFAHSYEELLRRPNLLKTRICKDYMNGTCPNKDEDCVFAHGTGDLRCTDDVWKTTLCPMWQTDTCEFNNSPEKCRWAHGNDELRQRSSRRRIAQRLDVKETDGQAEKVEEVQGAKEGTHTHPQTHTQNSNSIEDLNVKHTQNTHTHTKYTHTHTHTKYTEYYYAEYTNTKHTE
eukprot:GHVR01113379.1.p1 GENE.GHVR01113379.1~~GHVR01113379.1.p1  ORF type:complete len:199 (-),score=72.58 GHVR01113379.1:59-655(-)